MVAFASLLVSSLFKAVRNSSGHLIVRNAARRPVKVLVEEDTSKLPEANDNYHPSRVSKKKEHVLKDNNISINKYPSGFPKFEKVGKDDTVLSRFIVNTSCKKKRNKSGMIMLEGKRLIAEALQARLTPKAIFFSHLEDVISLPFQSHTFVFQKVTYDKLQRWSNLVTPPGVVGFFKVPSIANLNKKYSLPIRVVCDNVRDPGNLGCILRIAASVGCQEVLLTAGCVDVWDSKVLRAAAGSHFHVVVKSNLSWEDIQSQIKPESKLYVADNSLLPEEVPENTEYPDSQSVESTSESELQNLPVIPYYKVDFSTDEDLFLVVGGETMGISKEVSKLQVSHEVIRLHIPMENSVESLNVGTAVGILTYEMKRQLQSRSIEMQDPPELLLNARGELN